MILDFTHVDLVALREGCEGCLVLEGFATTNSIFNTRKRALAAGIPINTGETRKHRGRWVRYEIEYVRYGRDPQRTHSTTLHFAFNGGRDLKHFRRNVTVHFSESGLGVTCENFNMKILYPEAKTEASFDDDLR